MALTLNDLVMIYNTLGRPERASAAAEESWQLFRELGNLPMLADSYGQASCRLAKSGCVRQHGRGPPDHTASTSRVTPARPSFTVCLPSLAETPTAMHSGEPDDTRRPGSTPARRILVVDDNRDSADSLAMLLKAPHGRRRLRRPRRQAGRPERPADVARAAAATASLKSRSPGRAGRRRVVRAATSAGASSSTRRWSGPSVPHLRHSRLTPEGKRTCNVLILCDCTAGMTSALRNVDRRAFVTAVIAGIVGIASAAAQGDPPSGAGPRWGQEAVKAK
jgi:hypothetical protein